LSALVTRKRRLSPSPLARRAEHRSLGFFTFEDSYEGDAEDHRVECAAADGTHSLSPGADRRRFRRDPRHRARLHPGMVHQQRDSDGAGTAPTSGAAGLGRFDRPESSGGFDRARADPGNQVSSAHSGVGAAG
jgi:hypothetical protein